MNDAPQSLVRRVAMVAENSARHLAVPLANVAFSYLVIRCASDVLWGGFAVHLVTVQVLIHVAAWGNREYLLREMSAAPEAVPFMWQGSLASRAMMLPIGLIVLAALGSRGPMLGWLSLWFVLGFIYQSTDVVVLFARRFRLAVAAEIVGFAVAASIVVTARGALDETTVVLAWVAGLAAKVLVLGIGLWPVVAGAPVGRPGPAHFAAAFPFALLAVSGLLQSRIDLYVMAWLGDAGEMGRYQVTASCFLLLQAGAAFIVMPFVRELYRDHDSALHSAASRLLIAGGAIVAVGTGAAWVVLDRLYGFGHPWTVYLIGALLVLPMYRSVPRVYLLYKHGRESAVVVVGFAAAAVGFALAVVLIPRFSIPGALAASAGAQWCAAAAFEVLARRN